MMKSINIKKFLQNNAVLLAILVLVITTIIAEPKFLSAGNLLNIMRQFGPLSFVALGMTLAIVGGFIDLSLPGIISLVAVLTISLIDRVGQISALLTGVAAGCAMGILTSIIIIGCGAMSTAESVFLTFGMSAVYSALALLYTGGATQHMSYLDSSTTIFDAIGTGQVGIVPVSFIFFIVMMLVLYVFQTKTRLGREICLTGGNKVATRLVGISVKRSVMLVFAISGTMAAVGSIVLFSRITTASPLLGQGYETDAILAVVVGGTPLSGGRGSVIRTMMGVMLVTLLSNCMNLLGVSTYMQSVLEGAILIAAIWIDHRRQK